MKLTIAHNTTKTDAKKRLKGLLKGLAKRHSDVVSEVEERWDGDLLDFGFRARGMKAQGTMKVTEDEVVVEGRLPLLARPFESRIKSAIEKEARSLFRKA
jgi:putative polyhydroxyalkanoic acid system protein